MQKAALKQTLAIGMAILLTGLGCASQSENTSADTVLETAQMVTVAETTVETVESTPEMQALEAQLLASVVRVAFSIAHDTENHQSRSHGTVKDGRYLVTHNHYSVPMTETWSFQVEGLNGVTLYRADGTVLVEMPIMMFTVVHEDSETLVLDFGEGYFDRLGVPSANFLPLSELALPDGATLAQVDWDGNEAHIDWATLLESDVVDGTPVLVLDNGLRPGASGGGVFWNGYHVANNWSSVADTNASGEMLQEVSLVAVNSDQVAGDLEHDAIDETVTDAQPDAAAPDVVGENASRQGSF